MLQQDLVIVVSHCADLPFPQIATRSVPADRCRLTRRVTKMILNAVFVPLQFMGYVCRGSDLFAFERHPGWVWQISWHGRFPLRCAVVGGGRPPPCTEPNVSDPEASGPSGTAGGQPAGPPPPGGTADCRAAGGGGRGGLVRLVPQGPACLRHKGTHPQASGLSLAAPARWATA